MAALGITVQDVEAALRSQNTELPSGRIESQTREFTVLAETDLRTPAEFERVIIRDSGGVLVRLGDIGRAEIGAEDDRNIVRVNGRPAVGLGIVKQSTANTLEVARAVKAELPRLQAALPPGMQIKVAFDSSIFIEKSIDAVYRTMLEAMVLVVGVIFLFLRNWRATLIPFVTIPVSLIGAFIFLYAMGFTINVLTLLGLVLAIGLVVDDAIVMLENIYRHIEEGMPPYEAALKGAKEIGFAVMAMTLTLAAVFAPLAFAEGNTGKLFTEFALTVAAAVLVSGFVALTLTPMMASRILRHETRHNALFNLGERILKGLNQCLHPRPDARGQASAHRRAGVRAGGGGGVRSAEIAQVGAGADRGSRLFHRLHARARRIHHAVHRPVCAPARRHLSKRTRSGFRIRRGGARPGTPQPGQQCIVIRDAEAVGTTYPQPDGDYREPRSADVHGHAGRARLPDQPALAGPELPQSAVAVRGAGAEL